MDLIDLEEISLSLFFFFSRKTTRWQLWFSGFRFSSGNVVRTTVQATAVCTQVAVQLTATATAHSGTVSFQKVTDTCLVSRIHRLLDTLWCERVKPRSSSTSRRVAPSRRF